MNIYKRWKDYWFNTFVGIYSITSSPLWSVVQRFRLTRKMRANAGETEYKSFLLEIGDDHLPLKNTIPYPESVEIPSEA